MSLLIMILGLAIYTSHCHKLSATKQKGTTLSYKVVPVNAFVSNPAESLLPAPSM
jgi:hypothetical protein